MDLISDLMEQACQGLLERASKLPRKHNIADIQGAFRARASKAGMPMAISVEDASRFLGEEWVGEDVYVYKTAQDEYLIRHRCVQVRQCAQCAIDLWVDVGGVGHSERNVALCGEVCAERFEARKLLDGWSIVDPGSLPEPEWTCISVLYLYRDNSTLVNRYRARFTELASGA